MKIKNKKLNKIFQKQNKYASGTRKSNKWK